MYTASQGGKSNLNKRIIEIIRESLHEILGMTGYILIRLYLERVKNLRLEGIPQNMNTFYQSLNELLGKEGTYIIKEEIERRLSNNFSTECALACP